MHTVVLFNKAGKDGSLIFEANANIFNGFIPIKVTSLSEGTLSFETITIPNSFADIFTVSYVVAGCFHPDSNLYGIKCIKFTLDNITLWITKENATPEEIQELYYEELNNSKEDNVIETNVKIPSNKMGTWKSIDNPPKKDGYYMVKFKLLYGTECIRREFINGKFTVPYYLSPFDFSQLIAWLDEEE